VWGIPGRSALEFERGYISSDHFHYLPGRFRVGVPVLKGKPAQARNLATQLGMVAGIVSGEVNPVTGRVLLVYNPSQVNPRFLLKFISQNVARLYPQPARIRTRPGRSVSNAPPAPARNREMLTQPQSVPWHSLEPKQVLRLTGTPASTGLSKTTAIGRLKVFGPNELAENDHKSFWEMLTEPFKGFMTKLLTGAAFVSFLVGETMDAAVIVTIVILQTGLETVQGYRAEKSLAALKELSAPLAKTVREGRIVKIPARDLVPGDLIQLEAGDRVPADARLLESNNLLTDEASLTGESIPVVKDSALQPKYNLLTADKTNMIFAGTSVTSGKALAVVTATGMKTKMGNIAAMLETVRHEDTFLHKQMESLGKKTTGLVLISIGAIILTGLLRQRPLIGLLSTGVSLAVSAIPEGLPAVVTVGLAFGVQRMARRNAVVRRLSAVETLGGVTAICSDKTGTLTANEMTVKQIYAGGEFFSVSGEGYRPDGQFFHNGGCRINPENCPVLKQSLLIGALCNNAELKQKKNGYWNVLGDPTEGALLTLAAKGGLWPDLLKNQFCRQRELVFDAERRMMSVICRDSEAHSVIYTKGAPESLLTRCSGILKDGSIAPLNAEQRRRILEANRIMAGRALRVLALAVKVLENKDPNEAGEDNLIFAGLVGMADPPRRGVPEAIRQCQAAGIKVVMITGDHQNTAAAIAKKLGLLQRGKLLSGQVLEELSDQKLGKMVNQIAVYARTSPSQKLRIVKALQKQGHVVAMTGDGINDAPAVKEADIGIAMGRSGTDVTREAAGITLSDDNFTTIVAGVEEGRTVAANIGKATRYVLPGNWGQVLAVFLASVSGFSAPLVPSQILWINLVTEGFPAMALAADPPHPDCMKEAPYRPEALIFSGNANRRIIQKALLSGLTAYGVYAGGLTVFNWDQARAQTMAFSHLVISRVLNIFDSRCNYGGRVKNPYILPAASLSTAMLLLTLYIPWLNPIFKTIPLGLCDWGLLGVSAGIAGRLDSLLRKKATAPTDGRNEAPVLPLKGSHLS
jgi:Ca2+-transporting ATPase